MLHLATDANTGQIVASVLTNRDVDGGSQAGPLINGVDGSVTTLTGDGAYDRGDVYAEVMARHPDAAVTVPTQRDAHLHCIAEHCRMGWQRVLGYNWRPLVGADISRWKRVIGGGLGSQMDERQTTEVAIAARVLNHMFELGRPEYVLIA